MSKTRSSSRKAVMILSLVLTVVIAMSATFAWTTSRATKVNSLANKGYAASDGDVVITEDFDEDSYEIVPGQLIPKEVYVTNTGSGNVLVRVAFSEMLNILGNSGLVTWTSSTAAATGFVPALVDPAAYTSWVEIDDSDIIKGSFTIPTGGKVVKAPAGDTIVVFFPITTGPLAGSVQIGKFATAPSWNKTTQKLTLMGNAEVGYFTEGADVFGYWNVNTDGNGIGGIWPATGLPLTKPANLAATKGSQLTTYVASPPQRTHAAVAGNLINQDFIYYPAAPFAFEKNAYINGSSSAENGTQSNYQPIKINDLIKYELKISNYWQGSLLPPTVADPVFMPKLPMPGKIRFENGSFEEPFIATSALDEGHYKFVHMSNVPGWSTIPINPGDASNPNAYMIEIQQPLSLTWNYLVAGSRVQFPPDTPDGGRQYAELNAEVEGRLYQICNTIPNTKVYYEFYHGARGAVVGNNTDVMNFYLRAPGETGGLQKVCSDSYVQGSSTYNWGHYTGSYIVPAGQTKTEFAFESVSTTSGNKNKGNFLDGIRLYTNSYIDLAVSNNAPGGKARVRLPIPETVWTLPKTR